jgi:hypothetical protein
MMVDSQVDPSAFRNFVSENESILDFPRSMQRSMRSRVFGERYWKKQAKFRVATHGKQYTPIRHIIKASHKQAKIADGFGRGARKTQDPAASSGITRIAPTPAPASASRTGAGGGESTDPLGLGLKKSQEQSPQDWTAATVSPKQSVSHKSRGLTRALSSSAMYVASSHKSCTHTQHSLLD